MTFGLAPSTGKWVLRVACTLAVLTLGAWTAAVGFLWANEPRLVFRAHVTRGIQDPIDHTLFSPVVFTTSDGIELEGATITAAPGSTSRLLSADSPERLHGGPYWMLFCPGAGNSIHFRRVQTQLQQLAEIGYSVLAFDYRGFGRTGGVPTETGLYEDALAAYGYLTTTLQVPSSRVILAGRSLGSAVAVELATRVPSAGVVLLSPIESVPATGALMYPWVPVQLLATNRFESIEKIAIIRVPILLVHATNDRFVPLAAGRRLFSRITGPKLMLETGGGHTRAGFSPVEALADALSRFWPIALESTTSEPAVAGSG